MGVMYYIWFAFAFAAGCYQLYLYRKAYKGCGWGDYVVEWAWGSVLAAGGIASISIGFLFYDLSHQNDCSTQFTEEAIFPIEQGENFILGEQDGGYRVFLHQPEGMRLEWYPFKTTYIERGEVPSMITKTVKCKTKTLNVWMGIDKSMRGRKTVVLTIPENTIMKRM